MSAYFDEGAQASATQIGPQTQNGNGWGNLGQLDSSGTQARPPSPKRPTSPVNGIGGGGNFTGKGGECQR